MKMKHRKIVMSCLGVCILGAVTYGIGIFHYGSVNFITAIVTHQKQERAFAKMTASADRIVIRDGGFDCCGPVDEEDVLFVVTDKDEIKTIRDNIRFIKNGGERVCMCCGGPGMDWYKGDERIALTAFQHGQAIRWRGFAIKDFCSYGDHPLTEESQAWFKEWFKSHGVEELYYFEPKLKPKFLSGPEEDIFADAPFETGDE